jgi:hypothetical protein
MYDFFAALLGKFIKEQKLVPDRARAEVPMSRFRAHCHSRREANGM